MSLSVHDVTVPVFVRSLKSLKAILKKAEAFAEAKKIDPAVLLGARLALDMHPLVRQVQMASDTSKGPAARLAGVEPPSMADNESSFAELHTRLDNTIAFLEGLKPDQFEGAATREVTLKTPSSEFKFKGADYLTGFAIPNHLFHVTTAYAILRHNGVDIGKMDFLGGR